MSDTRQKLREAFEAANDEGDVSKREIILWRAVRDHLETPDPAVYALRGIAHWPFDVNKTAEDDLREIKQYAMEAVGDQ